MGRNINASLGSLGGIRGRLPHDGPGAGEDGRTQGQRFEIVPAADLGLGAVFQGTQQLGHRADESVRKPDFRPARLDPLIRSVPRRVVECAGHAGRIAGPADGAAHHAVGPLDTPVNADVGGTSLTARPGPDVIPTASPQSRVILQNVKVNAVAVWKRRARVRPSAGQDTVRGAKPVAKRVEVMNAHDERGQRRQVLAPRHPVGDCRMSMVANTGSPSQPRPSRSFIARTDWS